MKKYDFPRKLRDWLICNGFRKLENVYHRCNLIISYYRNDFLNGWGVEIIPVDNGKGFVYSLYGSGVSGTKNWDSLIPCVDNSMGNVLEAFYKETENMGIKQCNEEYHEFLQDYRRYFDD